MLTGMILQAGTELVLARRSTLNRTCRTSAAIVSRCLEVTNLHSLVRVGGFEPPNFKWLRVYHSKLPSLTRRYGLVSTRPISVPTF
jgi:hypothetical protein